MFFAAGGSEQSAEKEIDGARANLARGELETFEDGRLKKSLHRLQVEFDGELAVEIGPHHSGTLAFRDEAAEHVGDIFLPHFLDETVELGREALQVTNRSRV